MTAYDDYSALISNLHTCDVEQRQRKLHRLPLDTYTASDCEFFFTICAHRRLERPFADAKLATAIVDALLWRKDYHRWLLFCYCLMPDHLHFIVRLPPHEIRYVNGGARGIVPEGILDQVGSFKKFTTTKVWWKQSGMGELWQRSSYDHVIRYHDSVEAAVRYVVNNPVRKNMVEHWEDYPYTGIVDPW